MAEFDAVIFSDLHLHDDKPRLNELFAAFVDRVEGTPEVACLGDLLEYCIGRKHIRSEHGRFVFEHMQRLAKPAKRAIWVNGNRDHMFQGIARKAGYTACRNRYRGEFGGQICDLEHGDLFCSRDKQYQRFRLWFRNFPWGLLGCFFSEQKAHAMCRYMRSKSIGETARRDPEHYGIQAEAIQREIQRGARVIVCGHVHTPFSRAYVSGEDTGRLFVTSDWRKNGAVVCVAKDGEFKLMWFDGDKFSDFEAPDKQGTYLLEAATAAD
ncbi:MAG: metallophosphoesterase family protein [Planctomycetes bacterium]|nr:metallophosphoesterase family protein [Planctomycetota bacterium]